MSIATLLVFALALAVVAGSPGPSVAALVARVLSVGWREVCPFLVAMWLGELVWLSCAIAGLATIAQSFHWAFAAIRYAGAAYLLYLAWQMWFAPVPPTGGGPPADRCGGAHMFFAGLAVTLGNPKIMLFYLALLPAIVALDQVTPAGFALLLLTTLTVLAAIDLGYVLLASRARALLRNRAAVRLANRCGAAVMGGAALAIAQR